jgi:hypothetical protein
MRATSLRPVTPITASEGRSAQDALRSTKFMKTAASRTVVGFRNILFATDFSSVAAHAIPYVKRIAKHYDANLVAQQGSTLSISNRPALAVIGGA